MWRLTEQLTKFRSVTTTVKLAMQMPQYFMDSAANLAMCEMISLVWHPAAEQSIWHNEHVNIAAATQVFLRLLNWYNLAR